MAELYELRQNRPELSLRRLACYARVSYWQLLDFKKASPGRKCRQEQRNELSERVKEVALLNPTYGYRFLYQELRAKGEQVGLHRVRELFGELGLNPPVRPGIPQRLLWHRLTGRRVAEYRLMPPVYP